MSMISDISTLPPPQEKDDGTELQQEFGSINYSSAMHPQAQEEMMQLDRMKEREDFTRWTQSLSDELKELVFELKRQHFDEETDKWIPETTPIYDPKSKIWINYPVRPLANDLFIRKLVTLIKPNVSKNLINSCYSDELIQRETRSLYMNFIHDLAMNYLAYDVNKGDMSWFVRLYKSFIRPSFYRALNDGERKHVRSIYKKVDTTTELPVQEKKKGSWLLGNVGG